MARMAIGLALALAGCGTDGLPPVADETGRYPSYAATPAYYTNSFGRIDRVGRDSSGAPTEREIYYERWAAKQREAELAAAIDAGGDIVAVELQTHPDDRAALKISSRCAENSRVAASAVDFKTGALFIVTEPGAQLTDDDVAEITGDSRQARRIMRGDEAHHALLARAGGAPDSE